MDEIMVSICCLCYNQERYLRKSLDSMLMQKTNFKFEVLISDDASTDSSADILREYEAKYPDIIKPICLTENRFSKGGKMSYEYQFPRVKGKYVAMCEGDDYISDENKLQMQFDALEKYPGCSFCGHIVRCVEETGELTNRTIPQLKSLTEGVISQSEAIRRCCRQPYLFQTSSYFFRSEYLDELLNDKPGFLWISPMIDVCLMMYFATKGDFYYIDREMSCYRQDAVASIMKNVYTSTARINPKRVRYYELHLKALHDFAEYTADKYKEDVDYSICRCEVTLNIIKHKNGKIMKRKYRQVIRDLYPNMSKKEKRYYTLLKFFPFVQLIYEKLKG